MENKTQKKFNENSYSNNWEDYDYPLSENSPVLPKFTDTLDNVLKSKLLNKKTDKNIYNKMNNTDYNKDECLICYEKIEYDMSKVTCKLCDNIVHYKCYKKFIEKNKNYENKCCHCSTYSLKFKIKHWWNCCFECFECF